MSSLKEYLYNHIPLTRAMEVEVESISDTALTLSAPIAPNINHRETVFGGSASALCILSAWSLIHCRLRNHPEIKPRIVIQKNSMEYLKPVQGEFMATCNLGSERDWDFLLKSLSRKKIGRLRLASQLTCAGEAVGSFEGTFVVSDLDERS
jgi:thioesterase domain-containing protein